ncbi:MAG: MFS transporter [Jiangellaceae bacterium]
MKGRRVPLTGLLAAHAVSLTGNMITFIALPLYVLDTTGSASLTGVAAFFAVLPVVVGGALGGVLVDRAGYRRTSIVTDLIGGATILAVPVLAATVGLPFWALMLLIFATGLFDTPGRAARSSLLPEIADRARVPLERAVGTFEALERGARLVGGPVAGLLVAALGPVNTLVVNAATFAVSAVLVAWLVPRSVDAVRTTGDGPQPVATGGSYWRELAEGLGFLWRQPLLRAITVLLVVTNFFDAAWTTVILPVFADRHLGGSVALGLLVAAMGGGALVGSLMFGVVGHRLPRRALFVVSFLLCGGPRMLVFAAEPPLWACLLTVAVAGLAAGSINPIIGTVQLERTPPGMRARVFGCMGAGAWAAMPIGALGAGVAVERLGLTPTLFALGSAYLLIVLSPLLGGPWRHMQRPERSELSTLEPAHAARTA